MDAVRRSAGVGGGAIAGAVFLASLALAAPGAAIEWVVVGDPGNPADDEVACQAGTTLFCRANIGAVPYEFAIAKHEVTNQEYVAFPNAVADSDPHGLFNPFMQNPSNPSLPPGEIIRTGSSGSYVYSIVAGNELHPVRFIDYFRALRFANWLHNGELVGPQGPTTTEDGAYTLLDANPPEVARNPSARFWLPSEDEWYKAAFYDPIIGDYWDYATGSDDPPVGEPPPGDANSANFCPLPWTLGGPADCLPGVSMGPNVPIDVGSYENAPGPWGTLDQAGNVWEGVPRRPGAAGAPLDVGRARQLLEPRTRRLCRLRAQQSDHGVSGLHSDRVPHGHTRPGARSDRAPGRGARHGRAVCTAAGGLVSGGLKGWGAVREVSGLVGHGVVAVVGVNASRLARKLSQVSVAQRAAIAASGAVQPKGRIFSS